MFGHSTRTLLFALTSAGLCSAQDPFTDTLAVDLEVNPSSAGSFPLAPARALGRLLFSASTQPEGRDLWATDGTPAGTIRVLDGLVGTAGGAPVPFLELDGGALIFAQPDPLQLPELWFTDGTPAGSFAVTDGSMPPFPQPVGLTDSAAAIGRWAVVPLFASGVGDRLFRVDADVPEVVQITDIGVRQVTAALGRAFFVGEDGNPFGKGTGLELWSTDGTLAGTQIVQDLTAGPGGSTLFSEIVAGLGGVVFSGGTSGENGLWFTDGTPDSITKIVDNAPGAAATPAELTPLGNLLLFEGNIDSVTRDVWVTDGSGTPPTKLIDSDSPLTSQSDPAFGPFELTRAGGLVYARGREGDVDETLWVTDGTLAGTTLLFTSQQLGFVGAFGDLAALGSAGQIVFSADDGVHGRELWTSDGTLAGTRLLADSAEGPDSSYPVPLDSVGDRFYFAADDGVTGRELHSISISAAGGYVATPFGSQCGAALAVKGTAQVGAALDLDVLSSAPNALARLFVSAGNGATKVDSCTVHLFAPQLFDSTMTDVDGFGSISIPVPDNAALVGLVFQLQYIVNAPGGPLAGGFELSNGLEVVIGS